MAIAIATAALSAIDASAAHAQSSELVPPRVIREAEPSYPEGATGEEHAVAADALFVLIGAYPQTDWLPAEIARDPDGFLLTGDDLAGGHDWPPGRRPFSLETSLPGVVAAGDVRHGSVKRVAAAVGEGSIAAQLIHGLLADEREDSTQETGTGVSQASAGAR